MLKSVTISFASFLLSFMRESNIISVDYFDIPENLILVFENANNLCKTDDIDQYILGY